MTRPASGGTGWAHILRRAAGQLAGAGISGDPQREARRLLAHAMGVAPDRINLHLAEHPDEAVTARLFDLVDRRAAREPMSHITGRRSFFGRDFIVSRDVLDPRPETETLVATALSGAFSRVLDLGTGTGCILLSLLAERPGATGLGVDASDNALHVSARNAEALNLSDRARFKRSNWFSAVGTAHGPFDLVVSNPPYIAAAEMADLQPEVRDHEPRMALTDEDDGLSAYRIIAPGAADHLQPGGRILVEIGPAQAPAVAALFAAAGLTGIAVHPDLDGRDRVISARKAT